MITTTTVRRVLKFAQVVVNTQLALPSRVDIDRILNLAFQVHFMYSAYCTSDFIVVQFIVKLFYCQRALI